VVYRVIGGRLAWSAIVGRPPPDSPFNCPSI